MSDLLAALDLQRHPFPPTPDAHSFFFTPYLQEQIAELQHCIQARKGFMLMTGEVGLGKTTLVRRLLDSLPRERTCSALVFNTFLQTDALLAAIVRDFGLESGEVLDRNLAGLNDFLLAKHQQGKVCLLVIDDAQNLHPASLELVRLLCNLETDQEKLLQILLVGQPELEQTLDQVQMRQLKSRIVKHVRLSCLGRQDVLRYFNFRANAAGAAGRLCLHPRAARRMHKATHGNLRQIHLVLDRCLYGLVARRRQEIDVDLVTLALRDLGFRVAAPGALNWRWGVAGAVLAMGLLVAFLWDLSGTALREKYIELKQALQADPARPVERVASPSRVDKAEAVAPMKEEQEDGKAVNSHPLAATTVPAEAMAAVPAAKSASESSSAPPVTAASLAPASRPPIELVAALAKAPAQPSARFDTEGCARVTAAKEQSLARTLVPSALLPILQRVPGLCMYQLMDKTWAVWAQNAPAWQRSEKPQKDVSVVTDLQEQLVRQGLLAPRNVDGLYGPRTATALARFQAAHGLPITPTPDELTLLLLDKVNPPHGNSTPL